MKRKKSRSAAQKAASLRNIKKAQEARDKAVVSAAEKRAKLGKRPNALSGKQKTILGGAAAVGVASTALTGGATAVAAAASTGMLYGAMRSYNTRKIQEAGQRVRNPRFNLKGTNPNRLTSRQLAWSYGLGGVGGMGVVRGYNAVTGKKK
jgi:hypothetical protein